MQRHQSSPRSDWQSTVASQGLTYHSIDGRPYWDESAYWEFTGVEIDRLEAATAELQQMCLAAGEHMLRFDRLDEMHIPPSAAAAIRATCEQEPPALYGRMDLAYDGHSIKLLEYNADTPTSLLEASVIQWRWLEDCFPHRDQWNSIHEKLVAKWTELKPYVSEPVYFAHDSSEEDALTIAYLRDTAGRQASTVPASECMPLAGTASIAALSIATRRRSKRSSSSIHGRPCCESLSVRRRSAR